MILNLARALLAAVVLSLMADVTAAQNLPERILPVPNFTIYPGETIPSSALVERRFRSQRFLRMPAYDTRAAIVGKVARRTLIPGMPIAVNSLREPDVITQGNAYVVFYEDEGLSISATATALQSGTTGDLVALRNTDSGTIIRGIVQADATIKVAGQ